MNTLRRSSIADRRHCRAALSLLAAIGLLLLTGCFSLHRELPPPGRTTLESSLVILPAFTVSNYLVIEAKWDRHGPYRFLVDTGASVTLVSPDLAARYAAKNTPGAEKPLVRVRAAGGETALLTAVTLRKLELDGARFDNVQCLVYDCTQLSAHLGLKIDGILGFPLFRETLLTLDYPRSRVVLEPRSPAPLLPGTTIPFNNDRRTPIVPLKLGAQTLAILIDSGSDASLSLNPAGLKTEFAVAPRAGATLATLTGDREQRIGRLAQTLEIGNYAIERPVVDVTEDLSAIGSALLKYFTVTFDQERSRVTFYRDTLQPLAPEPCRSVGLSFSKTPAYWRVAGVVPGSPAESAGVQPGDLVTRINGSAVAGWDLNRYELLVASAQEIGFSFLKGTRETEQTLAIFDLVP